jgi:hypothetical protein
LYSSIVCITDINLSTVWFFSQQGCKFISQNSHLFQKSQLEFPEIMEEAGNPPTGITENLSTLAKLTGILQFYSQSICLFTTKSYPRAKRYPRAATVATATVPVVHKAHSQPSLLLALVIFVCCTSNALQAFPTSPACASVSAKISVRRTNQDFLNGNNESVEFGQDKSELLF